MTPKRPILRYHGGKWLLAPWIIPQFPPHRVYCESFGGAASILLQKPRSEVEVYNDLDDDTVNIFRIMRDRREELKALVDGTPFSRAEFFAAYGDTEDPVKRALHTLVRSFQGCSPVATTRRSRSGWRNSIHESVGTLPAHNWASLSENFKLISDRLAGVLIENRPAQVIIEKYDTPSTLHYVDPPYVASTRGKSGSMRAYRHEMNDAEHEALSDLLHGVTGMVVMSAYHSALYDRLFGGWTRLERATVGERAVPRIEVLWLNPAATCAAADANIQTTLFQKESA